MTYQTTKIHLMLIVVLCLSACAADEGGDGVNYQQSSSTQPNYDVADPKLPLFAVDELCGDTRELTVAEWAYEADMVAVGTISRVEVIVEPIFAMYGDGATASFDQCDQDASFSPGLKITVEDLEVWAGSYAGESLTLYIGHDLITNWDSQTTMKAGVLDWFKEERLQRGMRIGGTFFAHRDAYTPGFRPLFQIHEDGTTTFQGELMCLSYPAAVTGVTADILRDAVRNLTLTAAEVDVIKSRLVPEESPNQSFEGIHFSSSTCRLQGSSEPVQEEDCQEREMVGEPAGTPECP